MGMETVLVKEWDSGKNNRPMSSLSLSSSWGASAGGRCCLVSPLIYTHIDGYLVFSLMGD